MKYYGFNVVLLFLLCIYLTHGDSFQKNLC